MTEIAKTIVLGVDEKGELVKIPVEEAPLHEKLGYLDTHAMKIVINENQEGVGKHLILLHEMIHAVVENMKAQGLCKRQPTEEFVTNLAGGLFGMLAASGMWVGVSPEEAIEFLTSGLDDEVAA